jgi:hypothetical protein
MHMNLRQLKYFVSVVQAGNMTRAAEELHIAQTGLGINTPPQILGETLKIVTGADIRRIPYRGVDTLLMTC